MLCYTQVEHTLLDGGPGLFEDCVDAAYLLTMPNSTRDWSAEYQKHRPYSSLIVQYNEGFKHCHKPHLFAQRSDSDLADALGNVFRTALARNQTRILVLEDDFTFDHYDTNDIQNISTFVQSRKMDVYHLGTFACIGVPLVEEPHVRVIWMVAATGVIYTSPRYMQEYLDAMEKKKHVVTDEFWNDPRYVKYHYKKPICFQPIPLTENRLTWNSDVYAKFLSFYELDTSHKNWPHVFNTCIALSVIVIVVVPALILFIIGVYIVRYFRRRQ